MTVVPADEDAPIADEFGTDCSEWVGRAGERGHGSTLLAQTPALGTGATGAQGLECEGRRPSVGPVHTEVSSPVEFDVGGRFGDRNVEFHGFHCGPKRCVRWNAGMRPSLLADDIVDRELEALPQWTRQHGAIHRTYSFPSFSDVIAFVVRIGFAAEAVDHHPDIDIRWCTVHIALSTHDRGGVTQLDLDLAAAIDAFV